VDTLNLSPEEWLSTPTDIYRETSMALGFNHWDVIGDMQWDERETEDAIKLADLRHYHGTPKGFVELATSMFKYFGKTERVNDYYYVSFVTGGESHIENAADVIDKSFFGFCFWEAIHRGGLYTYRVHGSQWEADYGALGKPWRDAA